MASRAGQRIATPTAEADLEAGTRRLLVQAAVEAFSSSDYDGVSVRDVERRAGVNRGLAAYHFGAKEELWHEAVDWLMARFHDEMARYEGVFDDLSPAERLRILLLVFVRFSAKHPEFFRLLVLHGDDRTERGAWLADRVRPSIEFFRRSSQMAVGASSEDQAIAQYLFGGAAAAIFAMPVQCAALFGVDPLDPMFVERFADVVVHLFQQSPVFGIRGKQ